MGGEGDTKGREQGMEEGREAEERVRIGSGERVNMPALHV